VSGETSYEAVMARRAEITRRAVGIDYAEFERSPITFDYEGLMEKAGYSLAEVQQIQRLTQVGNTPLVELRNVTALVRQVAKPGKGARIFLKDESSNPSGSFKDRRASVSVYRAKQLGYPGTACASSGNYAAAVASQSAKWGLKCIIAQEVYDSLGRGQPEIVEKGRACEAYGAEVWQLTVGPELFYVFLRLLDETGYFSASLYTPFAIAGIETLGYEIGQQMRDWTGRAPDSVVITHAGGGNITGTARGLQKAGCADTTVIAASVDLRGLHMASDHDFNLKSFTTGHTGYGVPFATFPDRADVPRNAARALRYLDRYVLVTQGEVFFATEMLAQLEGMERGPAGNTALAAAFCVAQEMDQDQTLVISETEYTGAGKHPTAQLTFARQNGVEVRRGDPRENRPGKAIVIPQHPAMMSVEEMDLEVIRRSYVRHALEKAIGYPLTEADYGFLAEDTHSAPDWVRRVVREEGRGQALSAS
jgi:2-amino-4-ketopentanoate thiolase beta subunit